jgi:uncharacterized protein
VSGGLVGLLDDIASLAKLAAASVDDVSAAAGRASAKAAGVVVDDTAVTPTYVHGLAAERELPIIKRIALGSLRNKLFFILPAALLLSEFAPILVEIILMCGGAYLSYEGAEKVHHLLTGGHGHGGDDTDDHTGEGVGHDDTDLPAAAIGPAKEEETIAGAIRTDFVLSAEIMVIALKEVIDEGLVARGIILLVVAFAITAVVYGAVGLIVKMDDIGLRLVETGRSTPARIGRLLVLGMPKLLALLSAVGTAAMLWVGGHILLVGTDELGWHGLYDLVHSLEEPVHEVAGFGGVLAWLVNTAASAVIGLIVGFVLVFVVPRLPLPNQGAGGSTAH